MTKDDMIMKLLADYPDGKNWVLQIFTNLDVPEGLEDCEETELGTLHYASDFVVIDCLLAVETVWRGLACED